MENWIRFLNGLITFTKTGIAGTTNLENIPFLDKKRNYFITLEQKISKMIKTYNLLDGSTITATSPEDFVTQLREGSRFDNECTNQEFMVTLFVDTRNCMA